MKRLLSSQSIVSSVLSVVFVAAVALPPASAREFCGVVSKCSQGQDCCSEDTLEVVFDDGTSELKGVAVGDTFKATVQIDVKSEGIQGWSYAIKHDKTILSVTDVSFEGADFLSEFSGGFNVTGKAFGCKAGTADAEGKCGNADRTDPDRGIGQAVVLSFTMPKVLPQQDDISLAFATYSVDAEIPEDGTLLEWAQTQLGTAEAGPPVDVNLTVSGQTKVPNQVIDGVVKGAVVEPCAGNHPWGFFFGEDPSADSVNVTGNSFIISMRNEADASAFELAVKNDGGNLSFVSGEIGDGADNLRELIITDTNGVSQTDLALNTATISDEIASGERIGATTDTGVQDFFVVQTKPLVGNGFFAGYVADLTAEQSKVIPATPTPPNTEAATCPVNQILKINLGAAGGPEFRRGDVNNDEKWNITDGVIIVKKVFGKDNPGIDCDAAYDVNSDNSLGIDDAVFLLNWIFRRGDRPADPFMTCGADNDTTLGCTSSNCP